MKPSRKRRLAKVAEAQDQLIRTLRLVLEEDLMGPALVAVLIERVNYLSRLAHKAP